MPTDCEISWREHRPSIKGGNIFGMILNSSSIHHTANMRLLLITLICLSACLALPDQRQKRGILPGDPRYGIDYHHHHHPETVVEATKSIGYSYNIPDTPIALPQFNYGPPGYQPGLPLNNDYLSPIVDAARYSLPIPPLTKTVVGPSALNVKTISSPVAPLPLEKIKTVTVSPPATSYGTPVVDFLRTSFGTGSHHALKTVHTAPATRVIVKDVPSFTTSATKSVIGNTLVSESFPALHSIEGINLPSYNIAPYAPSTYASYEPVIQPAIPSGFNGLGLKSVHVDAPLTSVEITKGIPTTYPLPQAFEVPRATLHAPHSLTHIVQRTHPVQPLPTVHTVPTVHSVQPLPAVHSVQPLPALHSVQPLPALHSVQPLPAVHSVQPLPAVHSVRRLPAVHSVQPLPAVHSVSTVRTLPAIKSVKTVTPLPPLPSVHAVKTVSPLPPFPSVHSLEAATALPPLPSVHSIDAVTPLPHLLSAHSFGRVTPLPHLPSVHPLETVTQLPHLPSAHSFEAVTPLPQLPSVHPFEAVTPLPQLHAARSFEAVTPLPELPSVHSVSTVAPLPHLHAVKTVSPLPHVPTVHSVDTVSHLPLEPAHHIDTLHPSHSVEILPPVASVEPVHSVHEIVHSKTTPLLQRGPITDFIPTVSHNLPSFPSLPPLPSIPSIPSFPSLPGIPVHTSTVAPGELAGPLNLHVSDSFKDSITVDNPVLRSDSVLDTSIVQHVSPSNGFIQPTDINGGYIY